MLFVSYQRYLTFLSRTVFRALPVHLSARPDGRDCSSCLSRPGFAVPAPEMKSSGGGEPLFFISCSEGWMGAELTRSITKKNSSRPKKNNSPWWKGHWRGFQPTSSAHDYALRTRQSPPQGASREPATPAVGSWGRRRRSGFGRTLGGFRKQNSIREIS